MKVLKKVISDKEKVILAGIDAKMKPIQFELDKLQAEFQAKKRELDAISDRIRPYRKEISKWGRLKASLMSHSARGRYHPGMNNREFKRFCGKELCQ